MDTKPINDALDRIFHEEDARIVFWNDPEQEFLNVLGPNEVKFLVSNAPPKTPVSAMLLVGFSRWRVERGFEDQKSEIGLDQYEGRRYRGLKRNLILSGVSSLFLARMRQEFGGEKPGADGVPGAYGDCGPDPELVAGATSLAQAVGANGSGDPACAGEKCLSSQEPHQDDTKEATGVRH